MVLDITLKYERESRNCLEDLVVSVASWLGRQHELMYAESWGFDFDSSDSGRGERLGERISPAIGDCWGLLERHHGIKWVVGKNHPGDSLAAFVQGEVGAGYPVALIQGGGGILTGDSPPGLETASPPYILIVGFDDREQVISFLRYNTNYAVDRNTEVERSSSGDLFQWDGQHMTVRLRGSDKWQDADGIDVIEHAVARLGNSKPCGSTVSIRNFADALDQILEIEAEMEGYANYYWVPLFYNLMRVSHGRFQFARLLRHLSGQGYPPMLQQASERLEALGRGWNLVRSLLMKLGSKPGDRQLQGRICTRVRELAAGEEELAVALQGSARLWRSNSFLVEQNHARVPEQRSSTRSKFARPELEHSYVAPRDKLERGLAQIWQEVLGIEKAGIHDDFFELGGDSLLGIHVVALVRQAGLRLTSRQLFECRTIAELAKVEGKGPSIRAEQNLVTGPVPITPGASRFLEHIGPSRHHYNISVLLETSGAFNPGQMERAVRCVAAHHDALRLRFFEDERLGWRQYMADMNGPPPFTLVDLRGIPEVKERAAIEHAAAKVQASLNLSRGPLFRVTYFDLGTHRRGRLLFVVHHIAVDGMSERFPLEDLLSAYQQLGGGDEVRLPPKTTSFKQWAEGLVEYTCSSALQKEADFWLSLPWDRVRPFPLDNPEGVNCRASSSFIEITLSHEKSHTLLAAPKRTANKVHEVLLTALALALAQWTASDTVLVDMMHHGREPLFEHMDLSRTVGNFVSHVPAVLDLGNVPQPAEALQSVREQLRNIPRGGIGYGLLRYMCGEKEVVRKLRNFPQAEISFNCRAQFAQALAQGQASRVAGSFRPAGELCGPPIDPDAVRGHLIGFRADIINGRVNFGFTHSAALQKRSTVEGLTNSYMDSLDSLMGLIQPSS